MSTGKTRTKKQENKKKKCKEKINGMTKGQQNLGQAPKQNRPEREIKWREKNKEKKKNARENGKQAAGKYVLVEHTPEKKKTKGETDEGGGRKKKKVE